MIYNRSSSITPKPTVATQEKTSSHLETSKSLSDNPAERDTVKNDSCPSVKSWSVHLPQSAHYVGDIDTYLICTDPVEMQQGSHSSAMSAKEYAGYVYTVKGMIIPYFKQNSIMLPALTAKEIECFFQHARTNDDATPDELIFYHETLTTCLGYAVDLRWIATNPAEVANPCCDQAPILFADFIREWLGHSDISTTSNIYTHLDFSSKVSSANAILPAFPKNVQCFASEQ